MAAAGQFKDIIDVYHMHCEDTEYGLTNYRWVKAFSTRAKVEYIGGNKNEVNHETYVGYTKRFTVHYYIKLTETDRIYWEGKYWMINNIDPQKDWNQTVVICEQVNE